MRSNLLKSIFAVSSALIAGQSAAGGPTIPPSDPPYCEIPKEIEQDACVNLVYSLLRCPGYRPDDSDGATSAIQDGENDIINVCLDPLVPIAGQIACDTTGGTGLCEGYPKGLPESSYEWQISGDVSMVMNDRLDAVEVICLPVDGIGVGTGVTYTHGTLNLLVTNPITGATTNVRVPVTCEHDATSPIGVD